MGSKHIYAPRAGRLSVKVVHYLRLYPMAVLDAASMADLFGVTDLSRISAQLRWACKAKWLVRERRQSVGFVFKAGPALQALPPLTVTVPAQLITQALEDIRQGAWREETKWALKAALYDMPRADAA
jgi:hypothetical protein